MIDSLCEAYRSIYVLPINHNIGNTTTPDYLKQENIS